MLGILIFLTGIGLTMWAQIKVNRNFRKWSRVPATSGFTGAEIAREILNRNELFEVEVKRVPGTLTDHYDPTNHTVRLSDSVYDSRSISAISVASHECGHALQHHEDYRALVLRHRLVPALRITSGIAPWLLIAGVFFRATNLLLIGILFFSIVVLFHLVTLPVEFNASSRAKTILFQSGWIQPNEKKGVNQVLGAAAFTYVAGALLALFELIRFILIFIGQNED